MMMGRLAATLCIVLASGCTPSGDSAPETGTKPAAKPAAGDPSGGGTQAAVAPLNTFDELYVDVEAEPDEGAPPLSVQFRAEVEDNQGDVECEWDFKDGSPKGSGLNPTHVFREINDYEVYVRCRDAVGIEGEAEVDVFVEEE